jgi:hypothetical protein
LAAKEDRKEGKDDDKVSWLKLFDDEMPYFIDMIGIPNNVCH